MKRLTLSDVVVWSVVTVAAVLFLLALCSVAWVIS